MIRFCLLGSGSSGNAIFITTGPTKILIDNGLSLRQLELRLKSLGESLDGLRAIFVTHEHGDHVNGVGVLARRTKAPVFMSEGTYANLPKGVGDIPDVRCFESGDTLSVDGITLKSFHVEHDAADPVSYVIRSGGCQLGIASDLGTATHLVRQRLQGSNALVLESNYCPEMLRNSSYPSSVVQRIGSPQGHLSNPDMNSLLDDLLHDGLQLVVAVHISRENNTEKKARDMAARVLRAHGAQLYIAGQDGPSPIFELRPEKNAAQRQIA